MRTTCHISRGRERLGSLERESKMDLMRVTYEPSKASSWNVRRTVSQPLRVFGRSFKSRNGSDEVCSSVSATLLSCSSAFSLKGFLAFESSTGTEV